MYKKFPSIAKISKYCNRKCKNLAQKGKASWCKGLTKETCDGLKRCSEAKKRQWENPEYRKSQLQRLINVGKEQAKKNIGKKHKKLTVEKMQKKALENWQDGNYRKRVLQLRAQFPHPKPLLGKKHKKETIVKMKKSAKKVWQDENYKEKRIRQTMQALKSKPNKAEQKLFSVISNLFPKEYALNVKGDVLILGSKIPDVCNINGRKKVVEMFGTYWHSEKNTGRTKEEEEKQRIDHFKKYGYSTLIIWENELKNIEAVKQKITDFHMTNTRD